MEEVIEIKGYITKDKRRDSYLVKWYNPITGEYEYLGTSKEYKTCYILYANRDVEFYKEHRYLLPHCIQLDSKSGIFKFSFHHTDKFKRKKQIHIGSYGTLKEAEQGKKDFISYLV